VRQDQAGLPAVSRGVVDAPQAAANPSSGIAKNRCRFFRKLPVGRAEIPGGQAAMPMAGEHPENRSDTLSAYEIDCEAEVPI
jgi:hypothetical protein